MLSTEAKDFKPEKVTNFPESGLFLEDPQISRDGRQLLYRMSGELVFSRSCGTEFSIARAINFAHAAFADLGNNRVLSDRCAGENGFAQVVFKGFG